MKASKNLKLQGVRLTTARFLITFLAVVIFSISFTSAFEINPFAIKKTFEETPTADTGSFVKEKVKDFGVVKFKKTIFWIESEKLSEETLTKHDYSCFIDCESEGRITIYQDAVLFDSLKFYDTQGLERAKDGKMFIKEKESYFIDVPDTYKEVCEEANGTQSCRQEVDTYKQEERFKEKWVEYDGSIKPAGDYEYKIKVSKKPNEKLDFVYSHFGKEVREYAWFNQSWNYSRPVYMNLTAGSTSNNTLWLNITNMTNMLANGCDIRFTDLTNTTELKHWAEANSSGSWILEQINISEIVNTTNRTVAMLYYGNSGASCNGNITTAFTFGDDFNANTVASYSTQGSGTLAWNSEGYFYDSNQNLGGALSFFYPTSLANTNINGYRTVCRQMINTTATQARVGVGMFNASNPTSNVFFRGMWDSPAQFISEVVTGGAGTNSGANRTISANTWYVSELSPQGTVMVIRDAYVGSNVSYSNNLSDNGNTTYSIAGLTPIFAFGTRHLVSQPRWDYCYLAPYYPGRLTSSLGQQMSIGLIVDSLKPSSNFNFSQSSVYFTTNITDPVNLGLQNVSLYINGTLNQTNSSHIIGVTNFTGIALQDGYYNYTFLAYDNSSLIYQSSNGTLFFSVDTTSPTINVTSPSTLYNFSVNGTTVNFVNWTVNDTHLASCWYVYGSNITNVNCVANNSSFFINADISNLTFYANDSLNNTASWVRNWTYKVSEINQSYSLTTTEGNQETFNTTIKLDSAYSISQANITYNDTSYTAGINTYGNYVLINYSNLLVPSIINQTNLTFYWTLLLNDGTYINLTFKNQTVNNISIDNCSVGTNRIANFTVVDEVLQTKITNATIEVSVNLYDSTKSNLIVNYSTSTNTTNPLGICLTNNLSSSSNYLLDGVIKYYATNYAIEYYNIENYTLMNNSTVQNITLYDLNSSDSTEFQLTFKDSDYLISPGTLIYVNRQYIPENTFKTVELPKTDTNGQATIHLVRNSVIYNLIAVKNNTIVGTLSNIVAFCEDVTIGNCVINFNAIGNNTEGFNYYEDLGIVTSGAVYNSTSKIFTMSYVTLDASSKNVNLTVERENAFGTRVLCSTSLTSSSGSLSCDTSSYNTDNATLVSTIRVNGVPSFIGFTAQPGRGYGVFGYLVAMIFVIGLTIMLGSSSKEGMILGIVAGLIASLSLGLIAGGVLGLSSVGLWVILVGIIFLWKLNRGKPQ